MSLYLITGKYAYRGHQPGEKVEMTLDPLAEQRAIRRGSIRLIEKSEPRLVKGSYRLPRKAADAAEGRADAHQDPDQGRRPDST